MDKQTLFRDIKPFEWEELDGKTLQIRAGKQEGVLIVVGYDQETKDIFVLHDEKDPGPIPLPTIKPGDKVRHKDRKMKYLGIGNVLEISASGQRVRVEWPNYDKKRSMWEPYPAYYRLDKLEVVESD